LVFPTAFTPTLLDTLTALVVVLDREGRIALFNAACERLTGWSEDEVKGRTWWELAPPEDAAVVEQAFRRALASEGSPELEHEWITKEGALRRVAWNAALVAGEDGSIQWIIGTGIDVTERRRAEAWFRALIEKSSDMILVFDREGRVQFWSPSSAKSLGWESEEILGRRAAELVHPDDRAQMLQARSGLEERPGKTAPLSLRFRHRNGSWRFFEGMVRNLLEDPAVEGLVVNMRDITEQRQLEEQFRQSQRLESIGRLAGGVAHDFNNLLTVILSCSSAMIEDMATGVPLRAEDLQEIREAGERAAELTRKLLAFARKQVIAPEPLDVNLLVTGSEKLLRRVLGEDIQLATELDPEVWTVCCDPGQIEQVILNLAVNARDAMPGGGKLVIRTENVDAEDDVDVDDDGGERRGNLPPGAWVRLGISDSGMGMAPEVKERVFEPFFTTKPVGAGTGLGLATVYGIVKQSGGHILVESEPDRGTTFEVYLPRTREKPATATCSPAPKAVRGTETVLVVEDDPQVRDVTVSALRAGGYRVLVASDGTSALDAAAHERGPLHLLVADVVMPGLDGRTLADTLRRALPLLKVLFVSGYSDNVIAEHGVLGPGVELLAKPFTPAVLLTRVRAVLDAPRQANLPPRERPSAGGEAAASSS
jgi:PAS domain S-box-containing protein